MYEFSIQKGLQISQRWLFVTMAFSGICIGYSLRAILAISITQMVPPKESMNQTIKLIQSNKTESFDFLHGTIYNWDEYTQVI